MSLKRDLAKEIHCIEEEIKILEVKRARSQAALIEALISKQEPDSVEVGYFRTYTADIDVKRERMLELIDKLGSLV